MNERRQKNYSIPEIPLSQTTDVEEEFIRRLVIEPVLMKEAYGIVESKDLFSKECKEIFIEMLKLYERQESWDMLILSMKFPDHILHEAHKDVIYSVPESVGVSSFKQQVKAIKSFSISREIYQFTTDQASLFWFRDPGDYATSALNFFSKLDLNYNRKEQWNLTELFKSYQTLMESRLAGLTTGITTGFKDLDYLLGQGFQRKDLVIIGARPSVGKTSFSLTLAHNAAKAGFKCLFISLEMDANEILDRLLSFQTGIPVTQLIRGKGIKQEKLQEGYKQLQSIPLSVLHLPRATSGDVYAAASKHKYIHGLDLLVVDYLGYLSDNGEDEVLRLGRISKSLKTTANLLDCTVIAPHQLSRKIEQRSQEKREIPLLSDLRDSGHIEQDADVVMFLNRNILGETGTKTTLRLGKNRTGETGILNLTFNQLTTRFE
jgi:replicative DNA helicase